MDITLVLHNLLRWAVLAAGIWTVARAFTGMRAQRAYGAADNRSSLLFMISVDIQLLLGILLYVRNAWMDKLGSGMGAVMKNSVDRFFTVEHAFVMILAWLLVHIARSTVKRAATDTARHRKTFIWFGIALLLILISIPWPFREAIARPLFRI